MLNDPLTLALILVGVLVLLLTTLCIVLVVALLRGRRVAPAVVAAPLPVGPDVNDIHDEDVDITRVAPFLPTLDDADDGDRDDDDDDSSEEESKAMLHFEDDSWMGLDEPTGPIALIVTASAGATDRGVKRRRNEDALLVDANLDLYVVADGMGGYAGGDVASRMAVDEVKGSIAGGSVPEGHGEYPRRGGEIVAAIEHANAVIFAEAQNRRHLEGMGTTVLAARFSPRRQRVYIGHVGDSRAYRLRSAQLQMLTSDHTLAARGVTGPLSTNIRRAVGIQKNVKVDLIVDTPKPGDIYLFCSDGLSKMVDDDTIRRVLSEEQADLNHIASALVAAANAKGGRDNITVIVVRVREIAVNNWRKPGQVAHA